MIKRLMIAAIIFGGGISLPAAENLLELHFTPDELNQVNLRNIANVEPEGADQVLHLSIPAGKKTAHAVGFPVNVKEMAGKMVRVTFQIKYKDVTKTVRAQRAHMGAKVTLENSYSENGKVKTTWPQSESGWGSSNWETKTFKAQIKPTAKEGRLVFSTPSGEAWFSNVIIEEDLQEQELPKLAEPKSLATLNKYNGPQKPTSAELAAVAVKALRSPLTMKVTADWAISVSAKLADGKTLSANFEVNKPQPISIKDEAHGYFPVYNPEKKWYWTGTSPKMSLFDSIVPGTMKVASAPQKGTGVTYIENQDYIFSVKDNRIGKTPNSGIPKGMVYLSYSFLPQRIDSIVLVNGRLDYCQGVEKGKMPQPPALKPGDVRLGNLYLECGVKKLDKSHLFPITETAYPVNVTATADDLLPKTMAKLRHGGTLKILAWGDSITAATYFPGWQTGRWQTQFANQLGKRFPKANIELITEAWGGRSSSYYLNPKQNPGAGKPHNYQETVLNLKPDLIISHWHNDSSMRKEEFSRNYKQMLKDFKAMGTEWLVITPSLSGAPQNHLEKDPRAYGEMLRDFAKENRIAFADGADRWIRLWRQGIPYLTLHTNHYNHPGREGMTIIAESALAIFPEK
jgi:lysophospholipase L1-like esterase